VRVFHSKNCFHKDIHLGNIMANQEDLHHDWTYNLTLIDYGKFVCY